MTQLTIITKQKTCPVAFRDYKGNEKGGKINTNMPSLFFSWNEKPGTIWTIFVKAG